LVVGQAGGILPGLQVVIVYQPDFLETLFYQVM